MGIELPVGDVARGIDRPEARFAGAFLAAATILLLVSTLMAHLGLKALIDEAARPPESGWGRVNGVGEYAIDSCRG